MLSSYIRTLPTHFASFLSGHCSLCFTASEFIFSNCSKIFSVPIAFNEQDFDLGFLALVAGKRGEVFLLKSTLLSAPAVFWRTPHSCLAGASLAQPYIHSNLYLYLICCPDLVLLSHFSPHASFSFLFWAPGCFDASSV